MRVVIVICLINGGLAFCSRLSLTLDRMIRLQATTWQRHYSVADQRTVAVQENHQIESIVTIECQDVAMDKND